MKLILISPEDERADEVSVVRELFLRGLERYHLRKPGWSVGQVRSVLSAFPRSARSKIVLHHHHALVAEFELAGAHWADNADAPDRPPSDIGITSRACHDLTTLDRAVQHYDSVLLSPVFPSISKPGHGARPLFDRALLRSKLAETDRLGRRADVFALGGIDVSNTSECAKLGFDGVAVLGAVWQSPRPTNAFLEIQAAVRAASAGAHATTMQHDRLASR
ncbi:MAG TPA: thiamine phosphate synthase [Opitutaceae bacterium]|nr:thiamine phosphate synthase [Opitutaceae bacterium]